jgi:S-adenosylmethionine decarboxylase
MSHFGDHIIIDCYDCSFSSLSNRQNIKDCIYDIVHACNMKLMNVPVVYKAEAVSEKDKGGYTAFAVITESHISMHTFPYRGYISIDAYTCRNDLEHTLITDIIEEHFKPGTLDVKVIKRGTKFPDKDINIE